MCIVSNSVQFQKDVPCIYYPCCRPGCSMMDVKLYICVCLILLSCRRLCFDFYFYRVQELLIGYSWNYVVGTWMVRGIGMCVVWEIVRSTFQRVTCVRLYGSGVLYFTMEIGSSLDYYCDVMEFVRTGGYWSNCPDEYIAYYNG